VTGADARTSHSPAEGNFVLLAIVEFVFKTDVEGYLKEETFLPEFQFLQSLEQFIVISSIVVVRFNAKIVTFKILWAIF
jgi:hypothetical protein